MAEPLLVPTEPPVVRLAVRIAAVCLVLSLLVLLFRGGGDDGEEQTLRPAGTTTTSTTVAITDTTLFPNLPPLPDTTVPEGTTFDTVPPPSGERTGGATAPTTARPPSTNTTSRPPPATTRTTAPPSSPTTAPPNNQAAAGATREGTINGRTYTITGVYAYRGGGEPACDALCATASIDSTDGTGVASDVTATTSWVDRNGTLTAFGQTEWQTSWNPPRAAGRNGPSTAAGSTVSVIVRLQSSNGQVTHLRSDPTTVQQL